MDTPLKSHISRLEERLEFLNNEVMRNQFDREARNRIEAEIRAVNLALEHYRAGYDLEKSLFPR
jgi:DNA-binding transcriptional regulator GbsR (MarR family)